MALLWSVAENVLMAFHTQAKQAKRVFSLKAGMLQSFVTANILPKSLLELFCFKHKASGTYDRAKSRLYTCTAQKIIIIHILTD